MHETWYTLIWAYGYLNVCNIYDLYLLIMAFWFGKNRLMVNVKHLYLVAIRTELLYLVSNCIWMTAYEYNQPCRTLTFFFMLHLLWYFSVHTVMLFYTYLHMDKIISAAASMYGFDLDCFYFSCFIDYDALHWFMIWLRTLLYIWTRSAENGWICVWIWPKLCFINFMIRFIDFAIFLGPYMGKSYGSWHPSTCGRCRSTIIIHYWIQPTFLLLWLHDMLYWLCDISQPLYGLEPWYLTHFYMWTWTF